MSTSATKKSAAPSTSFCPSGNDLTRVITSCATLDRPVAGGRAAAVGAAAAGAAVAPAGAAPFETFKTVAFASAAFKFGVAASANFFVPSGLTCV